MYCSKCGKNIPDDSVFCPECGYKCGGNKEKHHIHNSNINTKKYVKYTIDAIRHPITTIKQGGNDITTKANLLYILIIALLTPLVKIISIKDFIMSTIESVFKFLNAINGEITTAFDLVNLKSRLIPKIDAYIEVSGLYKNIYFLNLFHSILLYGITLIIIYLIYRYLIKSKVSLNDFTRFIVVISIIKFLFVIITSLVLLLSPIVSIVLCLISITIVTTLLAIGLNNVLKASNEFIYIFPIVFGLSIIITNFICAEYVISIIAEIAKFV